MKSGLCLSLFLLLFPLRISAQDVRDSLNAAIKTDWKDIAIQPGGLQTRMEGIRAIPSPLGEGDPIRWAQAMPGVTTGADGSSAFYVRGGNMGNNLLSIDGVGIYGYSHLLGLTTIIPQDAIDNVKLENGGFGGGENNFTAAHLSVKSKEPSRQWRTRLSLNSFMSAVSTEGAISNNLSTFLSARLSPLSLEYRAVSGMLGGGLGDLESFSAAVGDIYGKLLWRKGPHSIQSFVLGSIDRYGFDTSDGSSEAMGWNNLTGSVRYFLSRDDILWNITLSANRFENGQQQDKTFRMKENHLSLGSLLNEYTLSSDYARNISPSFTLRAGLKAKTALFSPGRIAQVSNKSTTLLATAWGEGEYVSPAGLTLRAAVRGNYWYNLTKGYSKMDPEISLTVRWDFNGNLSFRGTLDRMTQYYHTLEGLPLGWSLDMTVPSGGETPPESIWQGGAGLYLERRQHSVSFGGFYKRMENIPYYKYAQNLFDEAFAGWEDHLDIGSGDAFGTELLYQYQGPQLYVRLSYTLSKTSRWGFREINDGLPFPAKFDRRHVLNANAMWRNFTASLILQSGHRENGIAQTYTLHVPGALWQADYYDGVNGYKMPPVIRLDLGYEFSFQIGKVSSDIQLGICNATNHFNPFMLYFDTRTQSWKEMALLPIMPNFCWRMSF